MAGTQAPVRREGGPVRWARPQGQGYYRPRGPVYPMGDGSDAPGEPLEVLAYLSRSAGRMTVLNTLTATDTPPGEPAPGFEPRDLRARTDISKATLNRVLTAFEERGWAERTVDGEYRATPLGMHLADEVGRLVRSVDAFGTLGEAAALLPRTELSIGGEHFADATVRKPSPGDPRFFGRYLGELLSETATFRAMSYVAAPAGIGPALEEGVGTADAHPETLDIDAVLVLAERIIDSIEERPGAREDNLEMLEAGIRMYTHDGHLPCNLFVTDDTVVIENSQVDGVQNGTVIETDDPTVHEWAVELFERYRSEGTEVTAADLAE